MSQVKSDCGEYVFVKKIPEGYEVIETVFQGVAKYGQVCSTEKDGVHTIVGMTICDKFPFGNTNKDRCEAVKGVIVGNVVDSAQLDAHLRAVADEMAEKRADERRIFILSFLS